MPSVLEPAPERTHWSSHQSGCCKGFQNVAPGAFLEVTPTEQKDGSILMALKGGKVVGGKKEINHSASVMIREGNAGSVSISEAGRQTCRRVRVSNQSSQGSWNTAYQIAWLEKQIWAFNGYPSQEGMEVGLSCKVLEVSHSGYYSHRTRPEPQRKKTNIFLLHEIRSIHERSRKTYGSPRIQNALKEKRKNCSRKRIARIMKENNIISLTKKKFRITTMDSNHNMPIAERIFQFTSEKSVLNSNVNVAERVPKEP